MALLLDCKGSSKQVATAISVTVITPSLEIERTGFLRGSLVQTYTTMYSASLSKTSRRFQDILFI